MALALALFSYLAFGEALPAFGLPTPQAVRVRVAAPHDPPRILGVMLAPREFGIGDIVRGKVYTSTNVASVEARVGAFATNLHRSRPGEFALEYRVPWVPFFLLHRYDVALTARNVDGVATTRLIPISVH